MDSLNLLSPEEKQNVKKIKVFTIVKNSSFLIISFLIITSTLFIFCNLILTSSNNSIEDQIENELEILRNKQILSTEDAIKQLNIQLTAARNIQSEHIKWSDFLSKLAKEIPDGIILNELKIINTSLTFEINGIAKDRGTFIVFKDNITNFALFDNVYSPISNLSKKDNIDFVLSGLLLETIYEN